VIDAYARVGLHRHWGSGDTASADGMKWDVHPGSLKSSYHIRYGGYGGIGYYLVSDTYIALFSRFLACGAYEGHAILDFVAENRSLLQPSTVHSDTHGQSAPIFGLAHLLGIELMPRIRSWQDLHLFRPDADARYKHIDGLFTGAIDRPQIKAHVPDMLRVVLSVRAGRLLPSAILRRLATYSRKNRLYFAFRELGWAIRTDFLLRYLRSIELRRAIGAATNKSELFNRYAQWVAFGSSGLATAATRDEQRKMVKYNHLVANLLIFHTVVGMTRALDSFAADGHGAAITPEALAGTSPYLNEHLNRFGSYELDLSKPPAPLPFELPPQRQPARQAAMLAIAPGMILLGVLALLLGKAAVAFGLGPAVGQAPRDALRFALALPQGSEFSFVLFAAAAFPAGVLSRAQSEIATLVIALSMAATPILFALSERFAVPRLGRVAPPVYDEIGQADALVIICGFGRMGQIVGRVLRMQGIRFTALEQDADQIEIIRRFGSKVYYGNPSRPDLLRAAGAETARLLVVTLADLEESMRVIDIVRRNFPKLCILARARNRNHAHLLMRRGVGGLVRETFHSSLVLTEQVPVGLGLEPADAHHAVEQFQQADERALRDSVAFYDDEKRLIQSAKQVSKELAGLFQADQPQAGSKPV